jgi:hypothetical protein
MLIQNVTGAASRIQQVEETVLFMFTVKAVCKVNMKNGTQNTVGMRTERLPPHLECA